MRLSAFPIALLAMASGLLAQKKPVTLDAVASERPLRGAASIAWAPDGRRFAYLENRSIWLFDVPSGQKKEVAALARLGEKAVKVPEAERFGWQNRGVAEPTFQWSSDGRRMLISAGGDLFLLPLDSGAAGQLTATPETEHDPKLSPDGRLVGFRRGHDLYALEVDSRQLTRLTANGSATLRNGELDWVYPEELELGTAWWWSPDSRSIAYLQFDVAREFVYPQADLTRPLALFEPQRFPVPGTPNADVHLGVVPATGGPTRWMDLGDIRDHLLARVYWAPDSQSLAVEWLNREQNQLDLKLADAATGASRVVLHEEDPYWINVNNDFQFLEGGQQFLWGSERDGFRHLYLYDREGKLVSRITKGEWEVSGVARVDEAAREVYYTSSEPSPLERQFYRIRLDGRHKERLTRLAGTHTISMGSLYYMDTFSSLTDPPRRTLYQAGGKQVALFREPESSDYALLPTEIVHFKAADGATLYARLIKPAGLAPGKHYPVMVMVYGGPHAQSVRNAWSGVSWDQALAQRGYVIWQVDNRGSAGRGHAFESKVYHHLGELELKDQLDGLRYLESLGFADLNRVGLYGWSYGGYMTLYSLCNAPGAFRVGVAGAPVTDWRDYDTIYTERYMGLPAENADGYTASSPIAKAPDLKARLLMVHNIEDDNVHFQNSVRMAEALERAGKQFKMVIYPQKSHGVSGPLRRNLLEQITEFIDDGMK